MFRNDFSDANFLSFLTLRTTSSVVKKDLPPADDATSAIISIPLGFAFGNSLQKTAYVRITK